MDTPHFHPQAAVTTGCSPANRSGLRVPFGLREGRVWAPREVEPGLACGCVCPACLQPLIAKAIESSKRVPHFAHCGDTACETGAETGIHLRAKQVIADRMRILLPAWGGGLFDMANPPTARDQLGRLHEGGRVDVNSCQTVLTQVHQEHVMDGFIPDVYALDAEGELLIEIRYSHAVDERKAERVRAGGYRMIEIDLSQMDRDTPHDPDAFERLVLDEPMNRAWICCPPAEVAWSESKRCLDEKVAQINQQIAEDSQRAALEEQQRRATFESQAAGALGRREYMRQKLRRPHLNALAELPELVAPERVALHRAELERVFADKIDALRQGLHPALDRACMAPYKDDWIYGVAPEFWRLYLLRNFVLRKNRGNRFNNRDVFHWVKRTFAIDQTLYRLFLAQYDGRRGARNAGRYKRKISVWAFTDEENALIPNFYGPVNHFTERLIDLGVLKPVPGEIGGLEVA